MSVYFQCLDEL